MRDVHVIERRPNLHASSLPSEFITCRLPNGQELDLFCKYTGDDFESCHGHRRPAGFEAEVYQRLVNPLGVAAPHCYGMLSGQDTADTWLFLEAVTGVTQVSEAVDQAGSMRMVAGEIGRFQRAYEGPDAHVATPSLRLYDGEFYRGWVRRTAEYAGPWHQQYPWLATLCERCDAVFSPLVEAQATIIHGELYPHNVLSRDGAVFLIDWQSTAIGAGEIDLASLTERWPADIVEQCTRAYIQERWPGGAPADFETTLDLARLYWLFRWLGDRPAWTTSERSLWRFEHLRELARHMGLIEGEA